MPGVISSQYITIPHFCVGPFGQRRNARSTIEQKRGELAHVRWSCLRMSATWMRRSGPLQLGTQISVMNACSGSWRAAFNFHAVTSLASSGNSRSARTMSTSVLLDTPLMPSIARRACWRSSWRSNDFTMCGAKRLRGKLRSGSATSGGDRY